MEVGFDNNGCRLLLMVVSVLFDHLADLSLKEWISTGYCLSQVRNSVFFELFGDWQAEEKNDRRQLFIHNTHTHTHTHTHTLRAWSNSISNNFKNTIKGTFMRRDKYKGTCMHAYSHIYLMEQICNHITFSLSIFISSKSMEAVNYILVTTCIVAKKKNITKNT